MDVLGCSPAFPDFSSTLGGGGGGGYEVGVPASIPNIGQSHCHIKHKVVNQTPESGGCFLRRPRWSRSSITRMWPGPWSRLNVRRRVTSASTNPPPQKKKYYATLPRLGWMKRRSPGKRRRRRRRKKTPALPVCTSLDALFVSLSLKALMFSWFCLRDSPVWNPHMFQSPGGSETSGRVKTVSM